MANKPQNIFRSLLDVLVCLENDLDQAKCNYAYSDIEDIALASNIDDAIETTKTLKGMLEICKQADTSKRATQAIFLDANNMPLILVNLEDIRSNDD